jgi:hypothetical protein
VLAAAQESAAAVVVLVVTVVVVLAAAAKGGKMGYGRGNGMAPGVGNGLAHGRGNGTAHGGGNGTAHGGGNGTAHGGGNGTAHGAGNGMAHGGGFGFGHAGVGNPGHNTLTTRSSHSQNTSHKGGTHDGRNFSNPPRSMHSLAQNYAAPSANADQVAQVDDRGPEEQKGFVESLPPAPELQADDRGRVLYFQAIHSDLDDIVTGGLAPGLGLNPDGGKYFQVSWQAKDAPRTIVPDTDDPPVTELPRHWELRDGRAMLRLTNPELDDDDDNWKFVPYFGAVLVFFTWILQSWTRRVTKGKVAA